MIQNPLRHLQHPIAFDEIKVEHIEPAIEALIADAEQALANIAATQNTDYAATFEALEKATADLESALGVIGHLESVQSSPELREVYNRVYPKAYRFLAQIPLNAGVWQSLRACAQDTAQQTQLNATQQRFVQLTCDHFRRHGAELDDTLKQELNELDRQLVEHCNRFAQNVLDATDKVEWHITDEDLLQGLPQSAREAARESAQQKGYEGWRLTLHGPSLSAALTYLDHRGLRQEIWEAYHRRASEGEASNVPLITGILKLRQRKAQILGYAHFGDLVLADRMAQKASQAQAFLNDLATKTQAHWEQENQALRDFYHAQEGKDAPTLAPWDLGYYAEKQRQARYDFDEEALRPYFPAPQVLEGMLTLASTLYDLRIDLCDLPAWDPSVKSYAIRNHKDQLLAYFYIDLYPREGKRGGAWMNPLLTGDPLGPSKQPHVGLFCANVQPPTENTPALLSIRDVETLFHEFGHLLHHALSTVSVRSLAGTNVAWDFVELPSQIMENWCWEKDALALFARHHATGESIPDELWDKTKQTRQYRTANAMMRQLGFAHTDLAMHTLYDPAKDGDVLPFARQLLQRFSATTLPSDYAMIASFTHLFADPVGYAAGYYSYKWAEVLDADAFSRFKKEGVLNPAVGAAFRDTLLSQGNNRKPEELFQAFMGRPPRAEALLERAGLHTASQPH